MNNKQRFKPNYGVYCCNHVFSKESDVLVVIRDEDWQFLCGKDDDKNCHLIHVGHLLERDPSLEVMAELNDRTGAMRIHSNADWEYFELDEE
jgi:hypothetical protein